MQQAFIRVHVGEGFFSTEKSISFDAEGQNYSAFVEPQDLDGDRLKVSLLSRVNGHAIIALPRETLTTGRRIQVPKELVEVEEA